MTTDRGWMRMAVDLGKRSQAEQGRSTPAPKVGVVAVKDGQLLGASFRGATAPQDHAEYGLVGIELRDTDLSGATVFSTLEPCSHRSLGKTPCAQRLADRGVATVFIGMYDPNPVIYRDGWRLLRDAGVQLRDFPGDLRREIESDNAEFIDQFRVATGDRGVVRFDYKQNDGRFRIESTVGVFATSWGQRGSGSIWAYYTMDNIAHARYAKSFTEIDDPDSCDFSGHAVGVREGEIVVFRNPDGFLLARILLAHGGPDHGEPDYRLEVEFEVRAIKAGTEGDPIP